MAYHFNVAAVMLFSATRFNSYCPNVELNSTPLSILPGPMSSSTRHLFPFHRVQCRAQLDISFHSTRSNVELNSTPLSILPGPMSSSTRHLFPFYRVQCRAQLDTSFHSTRSIVELNSTLYCTVIYVRYPKLLLSSGCF